MTDLAVTVADAAEVELRRIGRRCRLAPDELLALFAGDLANLAGADPQGVTLAQMWVAVRCPPGGAPPTRRRRRTPPGVH